MKKIKIIPLYSISEIFYNNMLGIIFETFTEIDQLWFISCQEK